MATYAYFCVAPWCIESIGHAPSWAVLRLLSETSHLISWQSALDNEGMSLHIRPWYDLIANASNVIGHRFCSRKSHQPLLSMLCMDYANAKHVSKFVHYLHFNSIPTNYISYYWNLKSSQCILAISLKLLKL